jgi:hypothetical protein
MWFPWESGTDFQFWGQNFQSKKFHEVSWSFMKFHVFHGKFHGKRFSASGQICTKTKKKTLETKKRSPIWWVPGHSVPIQFHVFHGKLLFAILSWIPRHSVPIRFHTFHGKLLLAILSWIPGRFIPVRFHAVAGSVSSQWGFTQFTENFFELQLGSAGQHSAEQQKNAPLAHTQQSLRYQQAKWMANTLQRKKQLAPLANTQQSNKKNCTAGPHSAELKIPASENTPPWKNN